MAESGGAPFEDELPPQPSSARATPVGPLQTSATASVSGPAPGSPEEAAIIFQALAEGAGLSTRGVPVKMGLILGSIVIMIAAVVGLVLGADYLRHVAGSTAPAGNGGGPVSPADTNLMIALGTATAYTAAHDQSVAGLTVSVLAQAEPQLSFSGISQASGDIAVSTSVPGSLVMASFQTSPAACVGVLLVTSSEAAPVFSGYSATASPGTYYFEAPARAGLCNALTVTPPAGGSYLLTSGFPTEPLP